MSCAGDAWWHTPGTFVGTAPGDLLNRHGRVPYTVAHTGPLPHVAEVLALTHDGVPFGVTMQPCGPFVDYVGGTLPRITNVATCIRMGTQLCWWTTHGNIRWLPNVPSVGRHEPNGSNCHWLGLVGEHVSLCMLWKCTMYVT